MCFGGDVVVVLNERIITKCYIALWSMVCGE
jgi:hypothetical protein